MRRGPAGALFIALILVLFSCSRTEPSIDFGFLQLVYYQGENGPEERFHFFIIPQDDDGVENLDELRLYHDREGLGWTLTSQDWVRYDEENRSWIGSRSIAMSGGEGLPRGQYRAELVNKGGERTERAFTFDAPANSRFPFPELRVSEGRYTVESRYPENKFICYDSQGNSTRIVTLQTLSGTIASLNLPSTVFSIALWAEDSEYSTGALTSMAAVR
jgi:hypothetical protein